MIDESSLARPAAADWNDDPIPWAEAGAWREVPIQGASTPPPVACVFCGCELYPDPGSAGEAAWFHFAPVTGRDANGCRVRCATVAHRADGWPRSTEGRP